MWLENNIEQTFYTFLETVFENKSLPVIKRKYNSELAAVYSERFDNAWKIFMNSFITNLNELTNDKTIPKASKYAQLHILNKKLDKYNKINNFKDFEQIFLIG